MFLAVLLAGPISLAPQLHPICEQVGYELLVATKQGDLTDSQASVIFSRCQINHPPLSPN